MVTSSGYVIKNEDLLVGKNPIRKRKIINNKV